MTHLLIVKKKKSYRGSFCDRVPKPHAGVSFVPRQMDVANMRHIAPLIYLSASGPCGILEPGKECETETQTP